MITLRNTQASTHGSIGINTSKAYLQQIYHIRQELKVLTRKREQIQSELYAVRSPQLGERVLSSGGGDQMIRLIAKAEKMTAKITARTGELEKLREEIEAQIQKVPHPKYRQVLSYRYELCMRWEDIAEDMNVSVRYIYKLHGRALAAFDKVVH